MSEQAMKAALRAAFMETLTEVGIDVLKQTSMFPLSRRKADREIKEAA